MDKIKVVNETSKDVVELYLSGTIREPYPWEKPDACVNARLVRETLAEIGDKNLHVYLNSGGGDVFESIEIRNLLKGHKGDLAIIITGRAGSGASIIATAGKVRMYRNTMQMVHKAAAVVRGNADDLRKIATTLEKIDESVQASYSKKFVGTEEELKQLIAEETWLTAEECLALGFCDEIIDGEKEDEPQNSAPKVNVKESLLAKYQKEPKTEQRSFFNAFNKEKESEV